MRLYIPFVGIADLLGRGNLGYLEDGIWRRVKAVSNVTIKESRLLKLKWSQDHLLGGILTVVWRRCVVGHVGGAERCNAKL